MKFEQRLVRFPEAKELIEKMAKDVKAGKKDLSEPLKKNLSLVKMYKGMSPNGVISDDMMIPIEVEAEESPSDIQAGILSGIDDLTKKIDEMLGLAKAEPVAKADNQTRYMLEHMVWKFRERMAMAQNALDTIEFAELSEATGGEEGSMNKEAFAKLLDFDALVEEAGSETVESIKKMVKADAPGSDPAPSADEGDQAPDDPSDTDVKPGDDSGVDAPDASEKSDDDDDDGIGSHGDLSPPLGKPGSEDGGDLGDVEIEV